MSKKRLLSIVISAVILLSFACTAMAAEKSERYVGDSTVNGSIYQTYYQVDAQTRTGVKKISVSGVLYEKGTIGTWQKVSSCSNSSTTSTCMVSSNFNTKPGKSYRLEYSATFATVYKGNIIKNLIMDCQSYTKYRPNETTGGIFVSWRRKEELPTGA